MRPICILPPPHIPVPHNSNSLDWYSSSLSRLANKSDCCCYYCDSELANLFPLCWRWCITKSKWLRAVDWGSPILQYFPTGPLPRRMCLQYGVEFSPLWNIHWILSNSPCNEINNSICQYEHEVQTQGVPQSSISYNKPSVQHLSQEMDGLPRLGGCGEIERPARHQTEPQRKCRQWGQVEENNQEQTHGLE